MIGHPYEGKEISSILYELHQVFVEVFFEVRSYLIEISSVTSPWTPKFFVVNNLTMSIIFEQFNHIVARGLFTEAITKENEDPVADLLSALYSGQGLKVQMSKNEDVVLENYLRSTSPDRLQVNTNTDTLPEVRRLPWLGQNRRSPEFPTKEQKVILSKTQAIPIYAVVNGNNELIVASPRTNPPRSSSEWFKERYAEIFNWTRDEGPVQVGLFFMNREDAEMYLQEVCKRDPRGSESNGLAVKRVGLNFFYETNRTSPPKVQVKLIADLEELTLLTTNKNKNITIHPKQKVSKSQFQGVPLYILRTQEIKGNLVQFSESFPKTDILYFFRREDAVRAMATLSPSEKVSAPKLELYNLESYLEDLEQTNAESIRKGTFVPTYESYIEKKSALREEQLEKKKPLLQTLHDSFDVKLNSLKRLYKGVVWIITSDTLPTEEDSW